MDRLSVVQPPRSLLQGTHRHAARSGILVAAGLFATDVGYGFLAHAPLGQAYAQGGIVAAFLASIIGTLVPALAGGSGPTLGAPRPAQTLVYAALLAQLVTIHGVHDLGRIALLGSACVLLAGLLQAGFGLLGLGRAIRYAPLPVLAGFTNGVAVSMLVSAALMVLPASGVGPEGIAARLAVMGGLVFLMLRSRRWFPMLHGSLVGLLAGSALYLLADWAGAGLLLGETLPAMTTLQPLGGLLGKGLALPVAIDWPQDLLIIAAPALTIATVNSIESLVIASNRDRALGTRHDSQRVLIGQGLANCLCGLLGGLPTAPSNSRLLVSRQTGGDGRMASLAFSLAAALILCLAPYFVAAIPKIAVAALLVLMAYGIADRWSLSQVEVLLRGEGDAGYRAQVRNNLWVMLAVMATALVINLVAAMAAGVLLAMVLFVRDNSRSVVSRVFSGDKRRSTVMRPLAEQAVLKRNGRSILLVELAGPLFFGSAELMVDEVELLAERASHIILDFRQVGAIEASGAGAIRRLAHGLAQRGVWLGLSSISRGETRGRMIGAAEASYALPRERWFDDPDHALEAAEEALLAAARGRQAAAPPALADLDALRGLDPGQIDTLFSYTREMRLALGDFIFRQHEPGDALYLLMAGRVEIRLEAHGGAQGKRLAVLKPGAFFGEMAVLRSAPRSADALSAAEATVVRRLGDDGLARLHAEHPEIAMALMRNIGAHLAVRLAAATEDLRYALAVAPGQGEGGERSAE